MNANNTQMISIEREKLEHLWNSHEAMLVVLRAILACDIPLRYGLREQAEAAVQKAANPTPALT